MNGTGRVTILSPSQDLITEVAACLKGEGLDCSSSIVVFPGKRPAHFLRRELGIQRGSGYLPPQIFSIDRFVEFLAQHHLNLSGESLAPLDALAILYNVHLRTGSRIGEEHFSSLESFVSLGMKLLDELEEVHLTMRQPGEISAVLQSVEFNKFHSLASYYSSFYRDVEQRGLFTRAMLYRTVAENINSIDFSEYRHIILAGFYAFTAAERQIVRELTTRQNVQLIFQDGPGLREKIDTLNVQAEFPKSARPEEPVLHFCKAPDIHGQVFALSGKLQEQLHCDGIIDQNTAVVLPSSDSLFPVVRFALSVLTKDEYNIALGYPLTRTPVYGFLESLMELIGSSRNGKFSSKQYLKFVLHPYTKNIRLGNRSDVTRILFHTIEEELIDHRAKLLFTLEELEDDEDLFVKAKDQLEGIADDITTAELRGHLSSIHGNTITRLYDIQSVGDCAIRLREMLEFLSTKSTANLHPYFRPYVERLAEVLAGLETSLLAGHTFQEARGYFAFIRQAIAGETVPFSGTPVRGVQVLGLLETRNLRFKRLYILDATDDVIPGSRQENLLLPQPIRKMLGLETYRDSEKLIEYYFMQAVRGASEVYFFYTENGKKEKSRFLQKLIWHRERKEGRLMLSELETTAQYRVRLENTKPEPIAKTTEMLARIRSTHQFSARALDTYLACKLKFYYQHVLRLQEREEASDTVDALDVGAMVHVVLDCYFQPLVGKVLKAEHFRQDALERIIDEYLQQEFGAELSAPVLLVKRQVARQLWRFIEEYQIPLVQRQKVIIQHLERSLHTEWDGYRITGRVDRIELRDGETYIIDYKTGANDSALRIRADRLDLDDPDSWSRTIGTLQLPLYMLLHHQSSGTPLEKIHPAFLLLGKSEFDESAEAVLGGEGSSPQEVYNVTMNILPRLLGDMMNVDVPFSPTQDMERHCPGCSYKALCGTQWVR